MRKEDIIIKASDVTDEVLTITDHTPNVVHFSSREGDAVEINFDAGTVRIFNDEKWDDAAKTFWRAMAHVFPELLVCPNCKCKPKMKLVLKDDKS